MGVDEVPLKYYGYCVGLG